jgi:hypothetical protein
MGDHDLGNTQAISGERSDLGAVRVGVLKSFTDDSRVDERDDTTESSGGGESGVGADGWNADKEGVEVLLGGNKTTCGGDGSIAGSELRHDQIGLAELATRVGCSEEELNRGSRKCGCLAGLTEVGQCSDGSDGSVSLFLAETINRVSLCFGVNKGYWQETLTELQRRPQEGR